MLQIAGSIFQGYFIYGLRAKGQLQKDLAAVGFDTSNVRSAYPIQVLYESFRVASEALYPALPRAEAEDLLAEPMITGFSTTLLGRFIPGLLPFFTPDKMCTALPRYLTLGVIGQIPPATVVRLAERHYETTIHELTGWAHVTTGMMRVLMTKLRVSPTIRLTRHEAKVFVFETSWAKI